MITAVAITWVVIAAFVVLIVLIALFGWRRIRLFRAGGVHVALRDRLDVKGHNWHWGVGRYRGDEFGWYRVSSLRSGPDRVILRAGLEIATRREPLAAEEYSLPADCVVLRCRTVGSGGATVNGEVEIAMAEDAMTGFLSWLESAPPGRSVPLTP